MSKDIESIMREFQRTNFGKIIMLAGVVLAIQEVWERILSPLGGFLEKFGFPGLLIFCGLIYWLLSKPR